MKQVPALPSFPRSVRRRWPKRCGSAERITTSSPGENALLGGVAAFAFLGVATAGYMTMRTVGIGPAATLVAKGAIDERAVVILADFGSTDSLLARAATEAFRVDLSQSDVVRLAEPSFVAQALRRMERAGERCPGRRARARDSTARGRRGGHRGRDQPRRNGLRADGTGAGLRRRDRARFPP